MKRLFIFFVFISFFLPSIPSSLLAKKDKYENWLKEEIFLIITKEEEKEFKKLKTDKEKENFIAIFWAKRDPTPLTEENEFKDFYYKRLEYVKKNFTYGSRKGVKSDMGRVYVLLGQPAQRYTDNSVRSVLREGATSSQPEVWVYPPMPQLGFLEQFKIYFVDLGYGYEIDSSLTQAKIIQLLMTVPQKFIVNPNLKEVPKYQKKFIIPPNSWEGKKIEEAITTGQEHEEIPVEWRIYFDKAMNGSTFITVLLKFNAKEIASKKAVFFGRAKAEDGTFEDFTKHAEPSNEEDLGLVFAGFPVMPKKYKLYLGIREKDSEKYSIKIQDIEVPNFWTEELIVSSPILTGNVEKIEMISKEDINTFIFGQFRANPRWNMVFNRTETLNFLYKIYNFKTENKKCSLLTEISIKSDKKNYQLPPDSQEIEIPEGGDRALVGGYPLPLNLIEPGKYELTIKITDRIANISKEVKAKFEVVE
ncbi:MAG: GWxTD domain-containing protein [Candidatus Aminicenantia bacterium]